MELRQFVTETLLQISQGIEDAQSQLEAMGSSACVNASATKDESGSLFVGGRLRSVEYVSFDVAILASSDTEAKAGAGLTVASVFNIGAGGKHTQSQGVESRVKFRIPVALPKQRVGQSSEVP